MPPSCGVTVSANQVSAFVGIIAWRRKALITQMIADEFCEMRIRRPAVAITDNEIRTIGFTVLIHRIAARAHGMTIDMIDATKLVKGFIQRRRHRHVVRSPIGINPTHNLSRRQWGFV